MKNVMKKSLSILLAVLMIVSSFSVVMASAADEEKPVYNATFILDMVDKVLAEQNLNKKIDLGDFEGVLKAVGITIKLNSVNELTETLKSFADIWNTSNILLKVPVETLKSAVGDLKPLDLKVWKTRNARSASNDIKIISQVVEFLKANTTIINKFLSNSLSLGLVGNIKIDGEKLNDTIKNVLGEGGVCQLLKEALAGLVYEKDSAEFKAAAAKSLDKLIFEDLATKGVDMLLEMADKAILANLENNEIVKFLYNEKGFKLEGALANFKYDSSKTLDGFVADLANAIYNYARPYLNMLAKEYGAELNTLLAESGEYGAPFAKLFDFTKLNAVSYTAKSVKDVNIFIGKLITPICSFKWNNKANLGKNLQDMFMWAIQNRDKTVPGDPYTDVTGTNFATYALALAKMIVTNVVTGDDRDTVVAKMNSCKNATEVLTILLPYLVNRGETKMVGDAAVASKNYEKILGDLLGGVLVNVGLPMGDYKVESAETIWNVLNRVCNYYLVDMNVDALFGISMTKTSTFLEKLDQVQAVLFAGTEYDKATVYIPALLKNILALDLDNFVKQGIEDAFLNKNTKTPAASIICTVVNNLYKSILNSNILTKTNNASKTACNKDATDTWKCALCGKTVCTAITGKGTVHTYKDVITKADATKKTAGKIVPTCSACKATTKATTIAYPKTVTLKTTKAAWTGKAITNTVTVKDTAGKVVDAKYYTVKYTNNTNVGTATATVTFKGNYTGSLKATYTIVPAQVKSLKASKNTKDSLTLTWAKVTGAKYYKVEQSTDGKKWTVVNAATTATSLTVKKLKANTKYQYRVTAMDSTKKLVGAASAVVKTGTATAATKVTLKSAKKAEATASWSKVSGATKYVVYKSTDGKKWTKVTTTKNAKTTSYKLTKLAAGKKIYVKVGTVNAYGETASAVVNVTVKK